MSGHSGDLPSRTASYEEIESAQRVLALERFLPNQSQSDTAFVPRAHHGDADDAPMMVLAAVQQQAFGQIAASLAKGSVVNLLGPRGSGKTTILRELMQRLRATVVALGLNDASGNELLSRLRRAVAPLKGTETAQVLLLDDWDHAASVLDEEQVADFQRLTYLLMSRARAGGLVFASVRPLHELQSQWQREILPRTVLASVTTVALASYAFSTSHEWEQRARDLLNQLIHKRTPDTEKAFSELKDSPLWSEILEQHGGLDESSQQELV